MWKYIEPVICNKLPPIVITILKKTGYDNVTALQRMNLEEILIIEKYVQENLTEFIRKDKTYSQQAEHFRFLPGHKSALIALPDIVNECIAIYEQSNSKSNPKKNKPKQPTQVLETLEINFTKEDEQLLKSSLIKKVEKYAKNIIKESDFKFPEDNISSIEVCFNKAGDIIQKCYALCTNCNVKTSCIFNKVWQISNFEKHLKDCYLGKETAANSVKNSVPNTAEKSCVEKPVPENEDDLSALLNERNEKIVQLNKSLENALTITDN